MTVIALIPTGSGLSRRPRSRGSAPACPRIRSIRKSVSRTTVSLHPVGLRLHSLAEPLPEGPLRRPQEAGGLLVEDPHQVEERELPGEPVDDVAEALALPFEGLQAGVGPLREIDRLRRHRVCIRVYGGLTLPDSFLKAGTSLPQVSRARGNSNGTTSTASAYTPVHARFTSNQPHSTPLCAVT